MKRSEINRRILNAKTFFEQHGFNLPPFAHWTPREWASKGDEVEEIRENHLGWDLTDFGSGTFDKVGLLLFTIRNGNLNRHGDRKTYAEKIMIVGEGQVTPMHFHWHKMEDIINRGGGNLMIELHNATDNDTLDTTPVEVSLDGVLRRFDAGHVVALQPGESITLTPRLYHKFWGESGKGPVLVGEVSSVNDDAADNCFLEQMGRFPEIEEDEPSLHLLCNEYPEQKAG